jgi:hypothetical protein
MSRSGWGRPASCPPGAALASSRPSAPGGHAAAAHQHAHWTGAFSLGGWRPGGTASARVGTGFRVQARIGVPIPGVAAARIPGSSAIRDLTQQFAASRAGSDPGRGAVAVAPVAAAAWAATLAVAPPVGASAEDAGASLGDGVGHQASSATRRPRTVSVLGVPTMALPHVIPSSRWSTAVVASISNSSPSWLTVASTSSGTCRPAA